VSPSWSKLESLSGGSRAHLALLEVNRVLTAWVAAALDYAHVKALRMATFAPSTVLLTPDGIADPGLVWLTAR